MDFNFQSGCLSLFPQQTHIYREKDLGQRASLGEKKSSSFSAVREATCKK